MTGRANVLFIDNFDSFVFNLVDEFARRGAAVEVWRNDTPADRALELIARMPKPKLLVLSPGPGTPASAGSCLELVRRAPNGLPILGVCLGHQSIVEALGGAVVRADRIVHGKASAIEHDGEGLFEGLPSPMAAGRYHSLVAGDVPEELEVSASSGEIVMAVRHRTRPVHGVQFHPESILTPLGGRLVENALEIAARATV
jgi:anthranilate synthase component 2